MAVMAVMSVEPGGRPEGCAGPVGEGGRGERRVGEGRGERRDDEGKGGARLEVGDASGDGKGESRDWILVTSEGERLGVP